MGKAGGYVREYSDVLLMFRLKALRPEKGCLAVGVEARSSARCVDGIPLCPTQLIGFEAQDGHQAFPGESL